MPNMRAERARRQSLFSTVIEQSTSQLFLITQSTGILAVVLYQLDYRFRGLTIISITVWLLTILLSMLFTLIYIVKAFVLPHNLRYELTSNIVEICCLASACITFGTIIDMLALVCPHSFGRGWGIAAYALAWVDVGIAFATAIGVPYTFLWCVAPTVDGMPPTVLLPAIAAVTTAATCGVVTHAAELSPRAQVPMIIVGYILLGLGLPFALSMIAVFIARLFNGAWPPRRKAALMYVFVGPLGQGAYAFQILGSSASSPGIGSFGAYNKGRFITENAGQVVEAVSTLMGLLLWGYAAFWVLFCLAESVHLGLFKDGGIRNRGYNISMWSPVFPLVWIVWFALENMIHRIFSRAYSLSAPPNLGN